jgi:hypothetical protein
MKYECSVLGNALGPGLLYFFVDFLKFQLDSWRGAANNVKSFFKD